MGTSSINVFLISSQASTTKRSAAFSLPTPSLSSKLYRSNLHVLSRRHPICSKLNSNSLLWESSTASTRRVNASSTTGKVLGRGSSGETVDQNDLLVVGPGNLGRLVAQQWRQEFPGCQIHGQTLTTDDHDELIEVGIIPFVKGTKPSQQFPFVIFCAPPSGNLDYAGELRVAASNWNGEGAFLFTSSSAPYDCNDNGFCDEDTPDVPLGRSPRADVLLKAEKVVLDHGGCVLRLAGLYKADRGAHTYWLPKGNVDARPDYILNLIHYEDAASLSIAILKKNLRGRIFIGCDNHPLSRHEIMDLVNQSGKFRRKFEGFTSTRGRLGKRLSNKKTRDEIGWEPKYHSFAKFLETLPPEA